MGLEAPYYLELQEIERRLCDYHVSQANLEEAVFKIFRDVEEELEETDFYLVVPNQETVDLWLTYLRGEHKPNTKLFRKLTAV